MWNCAFEKRWSVLQEIESNRKIPEDKDKERIALLREIAELWRKQHELAASIGLSLKIGPPLLEVLKFKLTEGATGEMTYRAILTRNPNVSIESAPQMIQWNVNGTAEIVE